AILGLPLAATDALSPAAMVNILGAEGYTGKAFYEGIEEVLAIPGAYPHIYGKAETRPFRKMGHVTLLAKDMIELKEKVAKIRNSLTVKSR
ncbi:MAG: 5-(carboxyamino)imidazole ribonucleotide synthase, partial [Bacteroidota bacterium]